MAHEGDAHFAAMCAQHCFLFCSVYSSALAFLPWVPGDDGVNVRAIYTRAQADTHTHTHVHHEMNCFLN